MPDRVSFSQQQQPREQQPQQPRQGPAVLTMVDLIDRLSRFDGPPEQFLVTLLAVQCHITGAYGGAVLRMGPQRKPEILALYPPVRDGQAAPSWLAEAVELAESVSADASTKVRPIHNADDLYGAPADRHMVMVPLLSGGQGVRGMLVFAIESHDERELAASRERIELTSSLLSLYEMRLTLQQRQVDLRRLRMAMETLAAVNEPDRFAGSAMAFCNELASRWEADHVGLGLLKGRYVHLKAMSHTEKFNRKMKLVQNLESAMEECLDQDIEIIYPPAEGVTYVCRSARDLSQQHGATAILSLPLRKAGEPVGVVTLQRPADRPFKPEEIEPLRLTCELCTVRVENLHEQDRWFGARMAATCRKGLSKLVGPTHTWVKVTIAAAIAAILFLTFAKGDYTAEGTFQIEPVRQQVVQAPFAGLLTDVSVLPNDRVKQGQLLGRIDTSELQSQLIKTQSDLAGAIVRRDAAKADPSRGKSWEAAAYDADAQGYQAEIDRLKYLISRANLSAPIDGVVLTGDLKKQVGSMLQQGQQLFEIAPLEQMEATLSIPEDQIAEVWMGGGKGSLTGELATEQHPGDRLAFEVLRVNPMAEVVQQQNVFKVKVRLKDPDLTGKHAWLRPGTTGMGQVTLGQRAYGWLWTHKLVNWVRMKLWW